MIRNRTFLLLSLLTVAQGLVLESKTQEEESNTHFLQAGRKKHEPKGEHGHDKSEEHSHHGHGHEASAEGVEHENSGRLAVYGMAATVILLSITFAMASTSNRSISNGTWRTLDNIIAIFLAVLVFQAIDELVYDYELIPASHAVLGSFIYAICLLSLAVGVSQLLKGTPSHLGVFAASSAHFVSFGFMHASTLGFEHHSSHFTHAVVIFAVVLAIIGGVFALSYQMKKQLGMIEEEDLMEVVDELENDAGAMAVAMSWTILVCYLMTNEFQDIEKEEDCNALERTRMFYYAIGVSVFGPIFIVAITCMGQATTYLHKRLAMFGSSVLAMCCAWAWLLWGKWYFHEHAFQNAPMFSRIFFAFWVSVAAMVMILVLAYLPGGKLMKKDKALGLLTVALIAGWAWEETFDAGIEILAEGKEGRQRHIYKSLCALGMICIVLPMYTIYFKPKVLSLHDEDDEK